MVLMIDGRKIVLETKNGTVGYPVADAFAEADGFVISLKQKISSPEPVETASTGEDTQG